MSISQNRKRKAAKAKRSEYACEIYRKIRQGILPRFHLATGEGVELERSTAKSASRPPRLTFRQVGTISALTKDHYSESPETDMTNEVDDNAEDFTGENYN